MPQAARSMDLTSHGPPLNPGPGCLTVRIGGMNAWRALPIGMADALEGASNAVNSFVTRPQMTPVDATASLATIFPRLTAAAGLAAANGAPGAPAAAVSGIATVTATNVTLTATWAAASIVPGGQPAANIAYTTGIQTALAAAASATFSAMASLTDMHVCPIPIPIPPHGPGFVTRGSPWVNIGGLSAARQQDQVYEACGGSDPVAMGCLTVFIGDGTNRSYATAEEAALAAMREANPRTTADNAEYGGWGLSEPGRDLQLRPAYAGPARLGHEHADRASQRRRLVPHAPQPPRIRRGELFRGHGRQGLQSGDEQAGVRGDTDGPGHAVRPGSRPGPRQHRAHWRDDAPGHRAAVTEGREAAPRG